MMAQINVKVILVSIACSMLLVTAAYGCSIFDEGSSYIYVTNPSDSDLSVVDAKADEGAKPSFSSAYQNTSSGKILPAGAKDAEITACSHGLVSEGYIAFATVDEGGAPIPLGSILYKADASILGGDTVTLCSGSIPSLWNCSPTEDNAGNMNCHCTYVPAS